jgi:hypothetical protein
LGKKADRVNFNRKDVKQLNEIEFSDTDDKQREAIKNLHRQKNTIMTEDNLKQHLTKETKAVNFENFYWLSCSFLSKLSKMAPNLQHVNLRRMHHVTNRCFAEGLGD